MKKKGSSKRQSSDQVSTSREIACLGDIPNVGPAVAAGLRRFGITMPNELLGRDPYAMCEDLCRITSQRHDPCLLDTFIAAVRSVAFSACSSASTVVTYFKPVPAPRHPSPICVH